MKSRPKREGCESCLEHREKNYVTGATEMYWNTFKKIVCDKNVYNQMTAHPRMRIIEI